MKCPLRLQHAPYDGGFECDKECAWRIAAVAKQTDGVGVFCAVSVIAASSVPGTFAKYETVKEEGNGEDPSSVSD